MPDSATVEQHPFEFAPVEQPEIAIALPDKPALEGLEAKWLARWEAGAVYRFDRTAERAEV